MFFKEAPHLPKYNTLVNTSEERFFSFQNIDEIVLHIDVNGTIIAEDKAGGETPADFIEKLIERAKKQGRKVDDDVLNVINQKLATREEGAAVFIFPSLFRLLDQLDMEKVPYRIMFRTFGSDIVDITTEIKRQRPGVEFAHIEFKEPNCDAMKQRQIFSSNYLDEQWVTVQENYEHWDAHGRNAKSGKQLCLNPNPRIFDIFLDDCVSRKDLIHVVDSDGVTMEKIDAIARGHLVDVDTLDAMYDDDYFIKQLVKASARYSDSLQFEALPLLNLNM